MQQRTFGQLGDISALTLGGGGIGQVWGPTTREEAIATVCEASAAVLYLQATDNSSRSPSGKIVSFHHRERGRCHGTDLVVLPAPIGCSRVHLPRHPYLDRIGNC